VATGDGRAGGVLRVDGSLGWRGDDTPLLLSIRGEDVLVSDTRDLRAVASPDVQVRYRAKAVPARVAEVSPDGQALVLDLIEPVRAISPGQSGVLYDGTRVLGGGVIAS